MTSPTVHHLTTGGGVTQPAPFYEDELTRLFNADCRAILPTLEPGSIDVLLTDPPYFQVKDEEWDRQWRKAEEFLAWLGGILDLCKPLLKPSASVWCFASPELTRQVEDLIRERFRVLNSIRWAKGDGTFSRAEISSLRRYIQPWEGIIFAEQTTLIGEYIAQERKRAGLSTSQVEVALGYGLTSDPDCGTRLCYHWERGARLPSAEAYARLRLLLGEGYLTHEYDDLVRPFHLSRATGPVTDLWTFPQVENYPGKHPCEKPASMLRHMLTTSTRPGALVLDPFAGSCSTLRVCKELGLHGIGMETERRYCRHGALRLSQDVLSFDETA